MKRRMINFSLIAASLLVVFNTAFAEKVCLKSTLTKKGKIKNLVQNVADGEPCPNKYTEVVSSTVLSTAGIPGPQGPAGPQGVAGPQGQAGTSATVQAGAFHLVFDDTEINTTTVKNLGISCPFGFALIACSGGVVDGLGGPASDPVALSHNGPTGLGNCWIRGYATTGNPSWGLFGTATCVPQ